MIGLPADSPPQTFSLEAAFVEEPRALLFPSLLIKFANFPQIPYTLPSLCYEIDCHRVNHPRPGKFLPLHPPTGESTHTLLPTLSYSPLFEY